MPGRFDPNDYVDCQERINRFWNENPNGAIWTELLSTADEFDRVVIRAMVFKTKPTDSRHTAMPDASGIAAEMKGGGGANSTSWHENGETSAIGRALANLGYATSRQDRPSMQEMQKVERHEAANLPPRARSTSTNTVPVANGNAPIVAEKITSWTAFWPAIEAFGLPRDKKALEALIGTSIGADPQMALEKVQAFMHDASRQPSLA